MISQELLNIEAKLLLNAKRESYMSRQLAQQRMTLSDLEWPFHSSHAISVVAELLVKSKLMTRTSQCQRCEIVTVFSSAV